MKNKMRIRVAGIALAALSAVLVGAAAAAPTSGTATVTIRHQMRGCHTWSYNGGAYRASMAVKVNRGLTLAVVNNDVMPHRFVQTSGPKLTVTTPAMNRMSAKAHVRFAKAGVYRFTTKAGEDYSWAHVKTTGDDNVLRLTVTVS
jgi:hypothetical protein